MSTAFEVARKWFLAGRKIDMVDLATELGVSRATLFRRIGNRDKLLGEVIWSLTEAAFARHLRAARGSGAARVADLVGSYVRAVNDDAAFSAFLRNEPERALRLLTTKASVVQRRTIDTVAELLAEEAEAGTLDPPLPIPDLAYLVVRIAESFIYTDVITGAEPDAGKARQAVLALLGGRE
ncbi:QsdR family transcriptional regulator [Amycolatopsis suaedae]|uniref:TetR/AcrR family transcriptional regulator n=1 Tax=Amycolatopsis suaedae TaxID=2510978 RepID=A0A4Q7J8B9_9PSEU|nr:QsdR family transcriptional regulator [Amycolatopsis suaedae]RZQ63457.1 TetR/AcrR family transcriptional regulator [Amycolatopsis suaedae]